MTKGWQRFLILLMLALLPFYAVRAQQSDSERLGMAIEYFTAGKYHEALLLFQSLDKKYKLNDRFKAYIGLCYYQEWDYIHACAYLDEVIPRLDVLAPAERSVYNYACGESHFQLRQYQQAIPYYNKVLELGYDRDKGDAYFRLGYCYVTMKSWQKAYDHLVKANDYYRKYNQGNANEARLAQIGNMIRGCEEKLGIAKPKPTEVPKTASSPFEQLRRCAEQQYLEIMQQNMFYNIFYLNKELLVHKK